MLIYKVTNLNNNKVYIGQTIRSLDYRKSQHLRDCTAKNYYDNYFHNALNKYGFDSWKWEVICECQNIEELNEKEIYYISLYDSTNKDKGYNLKAGGQNGGTCCDRTKQKIGITTKAKWLNPEIAQRMKSGLQKATEKWVEMCKEKRVMKHCEICGKEFFVAKWNADQKYCSKECASKNPISIQCAINASKIALKINADKYNNYKEESIVKIKEWIGLNKSILDNIKWNNLTFLNDLCKYVGVKDARTIAKFLGCSCKKELVKKLINISKDIC